MNAPRALSSLPLRPAHLVVVLALVATLGALTACDKGYPTPPPSVRADVVVTLPPKPALTMKPYLKNYPDGSLSVEEVVRSRDKYLKKRVTVRGVVAELVQCPEPPPVEVPDVTEGEASDVVQPPPRRPRTCVPPPHAYLVDKDAASHRRLLVYGSMWSPLEDYKKGEVVNAEGLFDIFSKDGVYLRQDGLLVLDDRPEPEPEPNADAGPSE